MSLARQLAFPFVVVVMTLLAVPFGVTIGRSGAMGGIGVGIALAICYWTVISVFSALGSGGALPPLLAAWAPNLLFGSAAGYATPGVWNVKKSFPAAETTMTPLAASAANSSPRPYNDTSALWFFRSPSDTFTAAIL